MVRRNPAGHNGEKIGASYGNGGVSIKAIAYLLRFFELSTGVPSQANAKVIEKYFPKSKEAILEEEAKKKEAILEEEAQKTQKLAALRQQITALGETDKFGGTQKEIKHLAEILDPDETIKAIAAGLMNGNTWLVTCTDRRVIFLDKGMIYGFQQMETPLEKINSISQVSGLMLANITIWDGASKMTIENVLNEKAKKFVDGVNDAIRESKRSAAVVVQTQAPAVDVVTQLEKLAALKEKGILTQEEFDQQKKKLLAL